MRALIYNMRMNNKILFWSTSWDTTFKLQVRGKKCLTHGFPAVMLGAGQCCKHCLEYTEKLKAVLCLKKKIKKAQGLGSRTAMYKEKLLIQPMSIRSMKIHPKYDRCREFWRWIELLWLNWTAAEYYTGIHSLPWPLKWDGGENQKR